MAKQSSPLSATPSNSSSSSSSNGPSSYQQKAQKKESVRWTLQDWLAQKDRTQIMDLWLATNSPSPYEYFLKGSYLSYTSKPVDPASSVQDSTHTSYQAALGAFAGRVGLVGQYENNSQESTSDLAGAFQFRVLGNANQGTHLNIIYGLRTREIENSAGISRLANQFGGLDLNLYLARHFGLSAAYNLYRSVDESFYGTVSGARTEAGLFIDFEALRVFGNWFSDFQENNKAGVKSSLARVGIQTGLQFFF